MIDITAEGAMKLKSADKTMWLDSNSNSFELSFGNSILRLTVIVLGDFKELTLCSGYKTIFKFNAGEF